MQVLSTIAAGAVLALAPAALGQGADDVAALFANQCAACHGAGADDARALRAWDAARRLLQQTGSL